MRWLLSRAPLSLPELAGRATPALQPIPRSLSSRSSTPAAPEVLLGSTDYSTAVDVWAAACVIAELFELSPLAPGASDLDQMLRVVQVRGTPTPADWPGLADLPDYGKLLLPDVPKPPLRRFVPNGPPAALDLLERMLAYDPAARPTAAEVRLQRGCCYEVLLLPTLLLVLVLCQSHDHVLLLSRRSSALRAGAVAPVVYGRSCAGSAA